MSTERILAAEREAHFDGDTWRKHTAAQERVSSGARYAADIIQIHDKAACTHLDRVSRGETGSICLRCFERWGPGQ